MNLSIPLVAGVIPVAQQLKLFANGKPERIQSVTVDNSLGSGIVSIYQALSPTGTPILIGAGAYRTLSVDSQYLYVTFGTPNQNGSIYLEWDENPAQTAAANTQVTQTNPQTSFDTVVTGTANGTPQTIPFSVVPLGQVLTVLFVKLRTSSLIQDGGYLQFYDSTTGKTLWGINVGSSSLNLALNGRAFAQQDVIQVQLLLPQGVTYEAALEGTQG